MDNNQGIVAILDAPVRNKNGPSIQIQDSSVEERIFNQKQADRIVPVSTDSLKHTGILREIVRHGELGVCRETLQEDINNGKIKLIPAFKRDNWPTHPLMARIKELSSPVIADVVKKMDVLCDEQDIKFQTLFRLSTIPLDKLFYQGDELQQALLHQGSYYSWANIPKISNVLLEQFQLQEDLVRVIVREQLLIISNRLKSSTLPLNDILRPAGIFSEKDWKVVKRDDNIYVFNKRTEQQVPVTFKKIANDLAASFHRDLHYIHSPRSDISFGLFLESRPDIPFSVLAIQKTDRVYKQNVLLALGYDPGRCIDFTRLYNCPGAPFNTSSAIFACAFQYLGKNYPNFQAALSAFMPTYTSGLSMISGGFDIPVMVKSNVQAFQARELSGETVWEHLTARRQEKGASIIKSVLPMFPTIELLRPIKEPRFEPLQGTKGKMFEI